MSSADLFYRVLKIIETIISDESGRRRHHSYAREIDHHIRSRHFETWVHREFRASVTIFCAYQRFEGWCSIFGVTMFIIAIWLLRELVCAETVRIECTFGNLGPLDLACSVTIADDLRSAFRKYGNESILNIKSG